MDNQRFAGQMKDSVSCMLGEDYDIQTYAVKKNNGISADGLVIRRKGEKAAPIIYLKDYYEAYCKGKPISILAERIIQYYQKANSVPAMMLPEPDDYEKIRPGIIRRIINTEKNRELLESIPHRPFLDLSIVYYYLVNDTQQSSGYVLINDGLADLWSVTEEDLYRASADNMPCLQPWIFVSLHRMIKEIVHAELDETDDSDIYVLSSESRSYGAVWMSNPEVLQFIAQTMEKDYYILPSSVHECLIVPGSISMKPDALLEMVTEINSTQVAPEEVLSDTVYRYDTASSRLMIAAGN